MSDSMISRKYRNFDITRFGEIAVLPLAEVEIADPQPPQLVAEERLQDPANPGVE